MSEEKYDIKPQCLTREAIGGAAYIGDLYDARSDTFSGLSIFKKPPPEKAIKIVDNHFTDIKFINSDTFSEKFKNLNIEADLKVSVLAGCFSLEGHGKYLNNEKGSKRAVQTTLMCNIKTKHETINLFCDDMEGCFALEVLDVECATHVVTEVNWGANSMVTIECDYWENQELEEIKGQLKGSFDIKLLKIKAKASVNTLKVGKEMKSKFSIRINADVLPPEDLPQTLPQALKFLKNMPKLVQSANNGKGKPIQYTLVPLSALQKYLKVERITERLFQKLDEQVVVRFVQTFDEILMAKQELNDLYNDLQSHNFCVLSKDVEKLRQTKKDLKVAEASLRSNLAETVVDFRSGKAGVKDIEVILDKFENGNFTLEKVRDFRSSYLKYVEKIAFADYLVKQNVSYIGVGTTIDSEIMKNETGEIFILLFGEELKKSARKSWRENRYHFLKLVRLANDDSVIDQTSRKTFIAVDLDICPDVAAKVGVENRITICRYKNENYISFDVLSDNLKTEPLFIQKNHERDEESDN